MAVAVAIFAGSGFLLSARHRAPVVGTQINLRFEPVAAGAGNGGQLGRVGNFLDIDMTRNAEILAVDRLREFLYVYKRSVGTFLTMTGQTGVVIRALGPQRAG